MGCIHHEWVDTIGGKNQICRGCLGSRPSPQVQRSREAYRGSRPRAGTDKARILLILETGEFLTEEITTFLRTQYGRDISKNQVASRVKELVEAGLVEDTDRTATTRTGHKATIWKLR